MIKAPILENEEERLKVLYSKKLLSSVSDPRFDVLTKSAVEKLNVPISTVSIIDKDKEIYKSCVGIDAKEGSREISFCGHAIAEKLMLICEDTLQDERFADNPYVVNPPFIRFYAGIKLLDHKSGMPLGVFCVKDTKPRKFTPEDIAILINLSEQAEKLINTF